MLREPVQHQLATLGLKAAASALERLNFSDEQVEGLAKRATCRCRPRYAQKSKQGHLATFAQFELVETTSPFASDWPHRHRQKLPRLRHCQSCD